MHGQNHIKHVYQFEEICKMWRPTNCTIHHGNIKLGIRELSTWHVREWSSEIQKENETVNTERMKVCIGASSWNFRTRLHELSGSTNDVTAY